MFNAIPLNLNPDTKTLRQFGVIGLFGFGLFALSAWRERALFSMGLGSARVPIAAAFLLLGVLCALFALVLPRANRPIYVGLSLLSYPIGFVVSHVMLALMFAFVLGPVALVMRILRQDLLSARRDARAESYWTEHKKPDPIERYFREF